MNTYLVVGDINYLINLKVKELSKDIDNIITFNLLENTLDEVLEEASYFSMFNDKKILIVKNANLFSSAKRETDKSKDDSSKLLKYLNNENDKTKIIFIVEKCDTRKNIYKLLKENNNVFIIPSLTKTEIKNKLKEFVIKNKYNISDDSLWYIINNSLGNFDVCINELNKIMTYYNFPCNIDYKDVIKLVSTLKEENNFKLVDSIISNDLESSLKYLEEIKILKVDPSIIISLLYREFKLMLLVLIYENNKLSSKEIMNNLKLQDWQFNKVKNNLRKYTISEIKNEIIKLSNLDYKYKSGLINKDVILIDYLMDLCE